MLTQEIFNEFSCPIAVVKLEDSAGNQRAKENINRI